ncbi:MAG: hypothetical protein KJ674_02690 [Nanoarchaeota archaeon]|nr:hypothetical protein [Nanoarchaeota archaeon]
MATFTISIPEKLKEEIDKYPDINWSEYIKKRFKIRINELIKFEKLKNRGDL